MAETSNAEPVAAQVDRVVQQLDVARVLLIHAVDGILAGCGNSYANAYTEKWLTRAKELGAYHGRVTGNIRELQREWLEWNEADNQRFPDLPDGRSC